MKKILFYFYLLFLPSLLTANIHTINNKDYKIDIFYPKTVQPGDAVFTRVQISSEKKDILKNKEKSAASVIISRKSDSKQIGKASLYLIEESSTKKTYIQTFLTGIPLSTFIEPQEFTLDYEIIPFEREKISQKISFQVIEKEFVSETIPLNSANTAIKTNTSKTRTAQIDKLNEILGRKNIDSVYDTESFIQPNPATRRTSFFGDRRVYAYSNGKKSTSLHYGIDFGVPTGNEVRSCANGKVVLAEDRISTGWSVVIEHLPGLYSLYYHNSQLKVKEGDIVQKGDLIAISGATGLATGPHIHWEIRLNMEAISPDFMMTDFSFSKEAQMLMK